MGKHSQHNEDEIIADLLNKLGISTGYFVEFGAWDGKHLSNTFSLYEQGWSGCYIEGDKTRVAALHINCPEERIKKVCSFVQPAGEDRLDAILKREKVERVDVLSIDIDSHDYAIWKGVEAYKPAIVIIEYNPTIPFDTRYINPSDAQHGNGALSLVELATEKGYVLVDVTQSNLIFVATDLAKRHGIQPTSLHAAQDRLRHPRFFFGYDGSLVRSPSSLRAHGIEEIIIVPWADSPVPQPLPRWLRKFRDPGSFLFVIRRVYGASRSFLRAPFQTVRSAQMMKRRGEGGRETRSKM